MIAVAASCCERVQPRYLEGLRSRLTGKQTEVALLRERVRQARLDTRQLRSHLHALGTFDEGLIPARVRAGSGIAEPQHVSELRSLLQWLAESVDLMHQVIFDCGGEVLVGGRRVLLQRMAAWQLAGQTSGGSDSRLKLSVPLDLQAEISGMLAAAHAFDGHIDEAAVQRLADSWDMVGTEVVSAAVGSREPAIFLVHRELGQAITIARWPSVEFTCGPGPCCAFDPERHFARFAASRPPEVAVFRKMKPLPELAVGTLLSNVYMGDRVEVECEGQWVTGMLQGVNGDIANIECDAAAPGVITVAPLASVRPARSTQEEPKKIVRHMRARSTG